MGKSKMFPQVSSKSFVVGNSIINEQPNHKAATNKPAKKNESYEFTSKMNKQYKDNKKEVGYKPKHTGNKPYTKKNFSTDNKHRLDVSNVIRLPRMANSDSFESYMCKIRKFLNPSKHILKIYKYVDSKTKESVNGFKVVYGRLVNKGETVMLIDTLRFVEFDKVEPKYIVSRIRVDNNNNLELTINNGNTIAQCEYFVSLKRNTTPRADNAKQAPRRKD